MVDWASEYNLLPADVRLIGSAMEVRTRIQHLKMEKDRIKKRYQESMREINDYLRNCEKWLLRLENDYEANRPGGEA